MDSQINKKTDERIYVATQWEIIVSLLLFLFALCDYVRITKLRLLFCFELLRKIALCILFNDVCTHNLKKKKTGKRPNENTG